jgi:hypothetical protein
MASKESLSPPRKNVNMLVVIYIIKQNHVITSRLYNSALAGDLENLSKWF